MRKGVESVLNIAASAQAEIRVLALICGHTIARSCSLAADPEEAFQHIVEGTEDAVTAGMKLDPASAELHDQRNHEDDLGARFVRAFRLVTRLEGSPVT